MEKLRRKLVLGSAAAPLVLTIRQASAHAKTSAMACLGKNGYGHEPDHVLLKHPHADEWVRAKCDELELTVWDSEKKKWVEIKDRKYFLGFDKSTYWQLDKDDPYGKPAKASSHKKGTGVQEKKKGDVLPVIYMNDDGRVVGMAWEQHGGKPTTKSCWASAFPKEHHYG